MGGLLIVCSVKRKKIMRTLTTTEVLFVSGGEETATGRTWPDVAAETLDKVWEGLKAIGAAIHEATCSEH
jgi:hypothetical protein